MSKVKQPNKEIMWFKITDRYIKFSLPELYLVIGLESIGDDDGKKYGKRSSNFSIAS